MNSSDDFKDVENDVISQLKGLSINDLESEKEKVVKENGMLREQNSILLKENALLREQLSHFQLGNPSNSRHSGFGVPNGEDGNASQSEQVAEAARVVSTELARAPKDRTDLAIRGSRALGLVRASTESNTDGIKALLDRNPALLSMRTLSIAGAAGYTLLHHAAEWGKLAACKVLVERGIDPWSTDLIGRTPLHIAAQRLRNDVVAFLKSRMGDVTGENAPQDAGGSTPAALCALAIPSALSARKEWRNSLEMLHKQGDHSISPSLCRSKRRRSKMGTKSGLRTALTADTGSGEDTSLGSIKSLDSPAVTTCDSLKIRYGLSSIPGFRVAMEDAVCIEDSLTEDLALFAVLDGHGGAGAAKFCSQKLGDRLRSCEAIQSGRAAKNSTTLMSVVRKVISDLDVELSQQPDFLFHETVTEAAVGDSAAVTKNIAIDTSGTTISLAIVAADFIVVANVGDSRTLIFQGENILLVTQDHSSQGSSESFWTQETKRIRDAGGDVTPFGRVLLDASGQGKNHLGMSRALGDFEFKQKTVEGGPSIVSSEPELFMFERTAQNKDDDLYILLACDGVWDIFSNVEAISIFKNALGYRNALISSEGHSDLMDDVCEDVAMKCLDSLDNVTLVAVRVGSIRCSPPQSKRNAHPTVRNLLPELMNES